MSNYYPFFNINDTPFRVMTDAGRFGHVQTTNNAWTELVRYALEEYTTMTANITVYVTGIRVSNHDAASFTQELGVKRVGGGNADLIGVLPTPKVSKDASLSLADFRVTEDGSDIVVECKAPNSSAMDWCGQIMVNHCFGQVQ